MNCLEARKCIDAYLHRQLEDERMEAFLAHLESCRDCMEEFEINHLIDAGVRKLDNEDGDFNISADFKKTVALALRRQRRFIRVKGLRYALDTLRIWSLGVMFLMLLLHWLRAGF